jgi:arsenical pump membrane protein
VIYGSHMPSLLVWLPRFAIPSVLSILATYLVLRWTQRRALQQKIADQVSVPALSGGGKLAAAGIAATALVLMTASALDWQLGLPTCLAGLATAAAVLLRNRETPWRVLHDISWGVLPLVAGLFAIVEALDRTGLIGILARLLREAATESQALTGWAAGIVVALACNMMNNLPAGLIAGTAVQAAHVPPAVNGAVLIGIDLGPNLSVTGSLATILWLSALRREGLRVGAGAFLRLGLLVMPPALLLALLGLFMSGPVLAVP